MSDTWDLLISKSSVPSGDAWTHLSSIFINNDGIGQVISEIMGTVEDNKIITGSIDINSIIGNVITENIIGSVIEDTTIDGTVETNILEGKKI